MATMLPPLPTDSNMTGPNQSTPPTQGMSPFSGGLPGMMGAVQQIEAGYKALATMLPSMAPIAAEAISKLRLAIPNAVGAAAGPQGAGQMAAPGQGLPTPPMAQG